MLINCVSYLLCGWILSKLAQIYNWEMEKNYCFLVTLTSFSRSLDVKMLKKKTGLSAPYLLKGLMDFTKHRHVHYWEMEKD